MYICLECHEIFEYPLKIIEKHNLETPPYETQYVSPCCYDDYIEVPECCECGEYITSEYIETSEGLIICENCYTVLNIKNN